MLSVSVAGGVGNIHVNKVPGQLSSISYNHIVSSGSDEDYMNVAQRLGNEVI